jgi:ABC-type transport system involved in multi-copper enzyme maturation permease subunit
MILTSVIGRELRAAGRQPFTYYLRTISVAALLVAAFLSGLGNSGSVLFTDLHLVQFWTIWILVPLLASDCLSRERREGTLGLLFLTRLKASHIVIAKGFVHGLRALSLWLAVLPVLAIPFLIGGVSWKQAVLSALINFSAICWALAAALLASTWSKSSARALVAAAILSIVFLFALAGTIGVVMACLEGNTDSSILEPGFNFIFDAVKRDSAPIAYTMLPHISSPGTVSYNPALYAGSLAGSTATIGVPDFGVIGVSVAFSALALFCAILIAGETIQDVWRDKPPSLLAAQWTQALCSPIVARSFLKRWMGRLLERNPVGWLQQRTWSGRLVVWSWVGVISTVEGSVPFLGPFHNNITFIQLPIAFLLSGSLALSAAGSFRRERETGVLELLLVSPISEARILRGRLIGLWIQFLPAYVLMIGSWLFLSTFVPHTASEMVPYFVVGFFALPIIGLYFSLRCRHVVAAYLLTLATALVPAALWLFLEETLLLMDGPFINPGNIA